MRSHAAALSFAAFLLGGMLLASVSCVNPDAEATGGAGAGGGQTACSVDADCPAGQSCEGGSCQGGCPAIGCDPQCAGEPVLDANGCPTCSCPSCTTAADCGLSDVVDCSVACEGGECVLSCGLPCGTDADCSVGERCHAGSCSPACEELACPSSCPAGRELDAAGCETCNCLPECAVDGDCAAPPEPGCSASCVEATCQTTCGVCNENAPCDPGAYCDGDRCIACPPQCDIACPNGQVIDANGCELCQCAPCTADEQCPQPGAAGCSGVCTDGACRIDCQPLCASDLDCAQGESCIGGVCVAQCNCPDVWAPVCGADGQTYPSSCDAGCAGIAVVHDGACDQGCVCPDLWAPVCGVDGITYGNDCEAACVGVAVAYQGECVAGGCTSNADCQRPDVCVNGSCGAPCTIACLMPDPVCGTDGMNYGCGAADAACHGVTVAYPGACRVCIGDADCFAQERCLNAVCLP